LRKIKRPNTNLIFSVFLTVLVLINAEFNHIFISLIILVISLFGIKRPEAVIPTFFLTSLSSDYFVAFPGIGFTRIFSLILIAGFLLNRKRLSFRKEWLIRLVFIFSSTLVTFLFSNHREVNSLLSMGLNMLVFIIFANYKFSTDEVIKIFKSILISVIIMTTFFGFQFVLNPDFLQNGRLTISEGVNENRFAMMLAQLSAYTLAFTVIAKKRLSKITVLLFSILSMYFILLSGSRSAFIGIVLAAIISFVILGIRNRKQRRAIYIFALLVICGYLGFEYLVSSNPLLAYRFNLEQIISSGGTRRWPRVVTELKYVIPNNLFFGVGLNAINEYIATSKYMSDPGSSHNIIVSMLAQVGIVGFVAYMSFYYKVIMKLIKAIRFNIINIIPFMLILTAIFNGIGEVMYSERLFWNALSLAGLSLLYGNNKSHGGSKNA
jgi:O-antigen ligase